MESSEVPPANEGLSTFTCFSRLPPELREMIWECLISVQRYLRIEGRWGKPATIGPFSISEGMNLSRVCSESRKVFSCIIACQIAEDGDGTSINRHFSTVLMTILNAPSLEILSSVTTDIDCIAIPRHIRGEVQKLYLALKKRVAAGSRQIEVIYTGISCELWDQWRPSGNHLMTPLADFKTTTGDDALSGPGYGTKFVVLYNGSSGAERRFLHCEYIDYVYDQAAVELCSTWRRLAWKDGVAAPVIKPGFILLRDRLV
ncbi:hypothetical protein FAGAP_13526 [Fusarium agapanthi]|uniref:2EXR domain-containing protein n=1 Tax=Fusarium agapanthi TaxID=1803897 RepID=A0A9P5AW11_9HYPO|nr:hypothetical protein FAGAP_13526 [Fusarium agapanthi]